MQAFVPSITFKLLGVAALCLLFLLPLALVSGLVSEREARLVEAEDGIARSQGRAQLLVPPVIAWTVREVVQGDQGAYEVNAARQLAPLDADFSATLGIERRERGIFEIPVYTARVRVHGAFELAAEDRASLAVASSAPRLVLPLADLRGVREVPKLVLAGRPVELGSLGGGMFGIESLGAVLPREVLESGRVEFTLDLVLSGTRALSAWPIAATTQVAIAGAWPDPSFAGAFLPREREVADSGFSARWTVLAVNRDLPLRWAGDGAGVDALEAARFSVELYEPLGLYRLNERSLKYGLLFVALTFGVFLLAELTGKVRVHPVQYLLVGAALAVFYIVLLALSEHLGFAPAYVLAAAALTAIIGAWGTVALGSRARGLGLGAWLAVLYGFLFMMVRSEDNALLIGAFGLLAMVAASLYLTRRIDWYALPAAPRPAVSG